MRKETAKTRRIARKDNRPFRERSFIVYIGQSAQSLRGKRKSLR